MLSQWIIPNAARHLEDSLVAALLRNDRGNGVELLLNGLCLSCDRRGALSFRPTGEILDSSIATLISLMNGMGYIPVTQFVRIFLQNI